MTVSEMESLLAPVKIAGGAGDRTIAGVYAGDLLSRAMSHVCADDLWITIMNNRNVIAVAGLADAAAVLLAEGVDLLPDALTAAEENGIAVYKTDKTVYEICAILAGVGV